MMMKMVIIRECCYEEHKIVMHKTIRKLDFCGETMHECCYWDFEWLILAVYGEKRNLIFFGLKPHVLIYM